MLRRLTIERAMQIILFALIFALAARIPVDTDTWWHLRSGEHILRHGTIYADPFSHTFYGEPWVNHSWGAQLILYAIWSVSGVFGLAIYVATLATAGMFFVYRMCSGGTYLRAFAIVIGAATAAIFWSPRPQMISFLLSAVVLYLLHLYKYERRDRLWLIPILMMIWGNLHAGFSIGFIFIGAYIAGELLANIARASGDTVVPPRGILKLIAISLIAAAALTINPYGLRMLLVPFETVSIGALQNFIQEWNSPNFHERQTWPFVALLLGVLGAAGASRRRLNWTDFILTGGTAFMALTAGRNIAVFAVAATPVLTRHLDALLAEIGWVVKPRQIVTTRMAWVNLLLVFVVVSGALAKVLLMLDETTVQTTMAEHLPVEAVAFINAQGVQQPIFNSYNWGGYLMFAAPNVPVFVDGRTDLYGDVFLAQDYFATAVGAPGWEDRLRGRNINSVFVEAGSGLAGRLRDAPEWTLVYEDEQAVIFERVGGGGDGS
ncbi:MAG: hypothetical protein SNJ59_09580 [Aggregatilineales bacterium]